MCNIREIYYDDALYLFLSLQNPLVRKYSRLKPDTIEEMIEMIEMLQQARDVIARVIVDDEDTAIGLIALWDYNGKEGYLATWLMQSCWGKGYNQQAKSLFLSEIFALGVENVFILIRDNNHRSLAAIQKLPYVTGITAQQELLLRRRNPNIQSDHIIFQIPQYRFLATELVS